MTVRSPFAIAADLIDPPESPHLTDPSGWIADRLGEQLWSKQVEVAEALLAEPKVAVPSCHAAGKSFIAARTAAWWLDVHPPGSAFVVTSAPSFPQVRAILWKEIRRAHRKGNLPGRVNQTEWHLADEIVAYGRKTADYDETGFQGIHARYVLVILDEACGIPPALWVAVDAITTGPDCRILAIGNPDDTASEFAKVCGPSSGWHVIRIDGLDTPNVDRATLTKALEDEDLDPDQYGDLLDQCRDDRERVPDALRYELLSPKWIADKARRWGTSSPLFVAKVRGEFPDESAGSVIPLSWVRQAQQRWHDGKAEGPLTQAGVDVADEGDDRTTVAMRHGWRIDRIEVVPPGDPMHTVGHVNLLVADSATAVVDGIGVGSGVVARRRELGKPTVSFIASKGAQDMTDQSGEFGFMNCRAAAWWGLREMLDPANGLPIALPDDEELAAELIAPRWEPTSGGRIKVESKDDIRKRLGRSTDLADAVIQAFWTEPVGRREVDDESGGEGGFGVSVDADDYSLV